MKQQSAGRGVGAFVRMASRPIPRVARMMKVAKELGRSCLFIGAFREDKLPVEDNWEGTPVRRVGAFFPLLNGTRPGLYAWSILRYWKGVSQELVRERPSFVHASDFEASIPCAVYCTVTRTPFIYNIHDNLAVRYVLPDSAATVLNVLEAGMVLWSDVTLVPEPFRRDLLPAFCRKRVQVIRNTPVDPGVHPPPPRADRPRVMFAGWLDRGRGLGELLDLARRDEIELVLAGEGDANIVEEVAKIPRATYLGFLPHARVLEETARCHFVAAFYDPRRPINRFAASNKIAEALSIGRPVLTNSELRVAEEIQSAGCALVISYASIPSLGRLMNEALDSGAYERMCAAARKHYEREFDWNLVRERTRDIYTTIGISP